MTPRPCPCGLPEPFDACCGRYLDHDGPAAPTAEALMRSRYTAFARGDAEYLLRTWHPDTRPADLELDPSVRWTGLEIVDRSGGGLFDTDGVVEFRAQHRDGPRTGEQHERSRFVRESGRWLYRDGVVDPARPRPRPPSGGTAVAPGAREPRSRPPAPPRLAGRDGA